VRVVSLQAGFGMVRRLATLGIEPGMELTVVQNRFAGPVLVQVDQVPVAVPRGMATRVFVEPERAAPSGASRGGRLPLSELLPGQQATIVRITGDGVLRQRLLDMGLTRGSVVRVERFAPLGDPIEVSVKGYHLAIRRTEARCIEVSLDSQSA